MADDPNKRELDGKLISLTQDHEARYWCDALDVTPGRLVEAVKAVGHSAEAVRTWLDENGR